MLVQLEFAGLAPGAQFVYRLSDSDFALCSFGKDFDVLLVLEHGGDRIDQVLEGHVVEGYFFWHVEDVGEPSPVLLLERLSGTELDNRPGLLVVLDLL